MICVSDAVPGHLIKRAGVFFNTLLNFTQNNGEIFRFITERWQTWIFALFQKAARMKNRNKNPHYSQADDFYTAPSGVGVGAVLRFSRGVTRACILR